MKCIMCGDSFKKSQWNDSNQCLNCLDTDIDTAYDPDYSADVEVLTNPTGKTQPVFYDE